MNSPGIHAVFTHSEWHLQAVRWTLPSKAADDDACVTFSG
jgi:hypothetical protein